jgi:hypothetical protein
MEETTSLESFDYASRDGCVLNVSCGNPVTALDDLVAANLYQCNCLGVAGLEAYRRARGNVKSVAMCSYAVEL